MSAFTLALAPVSGTAPTAASRRPAPSRAESRPSDFADMLDTASSNTVVSPPASKASAPSDDKTDPMVTEASSTAETTAPIDGTAGTPAVPVAQPPVPVVPEPAPEDGNGADAATGTVLPVALPDATEAAAAESAALASPVAPAPSEAPVAPLTAETADGAPLSSPGFEPEAASEGDAPALAPTLAAASRDGNASASRVASNAATASEDTPSARSESGNAAPSGSTAASDAPAPASPSGARPAAEAPLVVAAATDAGESTQPQQTAAATAGPTVELSTAATTGLPTMSQTALQATAQIAAQIVRKLEGRSTRFEMALTPDELGRVDVSLDIDADGQLSARLAFDNPLAAADLRGRVDELRRQLTDAGFTVADDAFSFDQREPSAGNGNSFDRGADRNPARAFGAASRLSLDADIGLNPPRWISLTLTPDRVDMKV